MLKSIAEKDNTMFRVDADDVEMIGCTVIPNTFLVETLSKRKNI